MTTALRDGSPPGNDEAPGPKTRGSAGRPIETAAIASHLEGSATDDLPAASIATLVRDFRAWQPVDLGPVLDGSYCPAMPTVGARDDGIGLFYPNRVHSVAGETESAKSWLMVLQAIVELKRGNAVAYIDFEDDEGGVVSRLLALGAKREDIRDRFAYLRPEQPIGGLGNQGDLEQVLGDIRPTLAVLDGVTEAMTLHGLDPLSNKDAAAFGRLVPRYIADHGPAVVALDHVTKSAEGRGRYAIGAVHKLNGLNGSALLMQNRTPFGVGRTGRSSVLVSKDRPGQVRRHGVATSGGGVLLADFILTGHDQTFAEASLEPPPVSTSDDSFRPTVLMRRISEALTKAGRPLSKSEIEDRISGRAAVVRQALAQLIDEGFVKVATGPRNAQLHSLAKPFIEEGNS